MKLSHAEFAYNRSSTYATKHSPFEVVYGLSLPIDLVPWPEEEYIHVDPKTKAGAILKLYSQVKERIKRVNERYKTLAMMQDLYIQRFELYTEQLRK